ncbi:hypothetical protein E2562_031926 [Oryza meyeriana var. granulata]|uniref:Uncharacterized protein n=1 Tax=Oryza meyeriana var. granulata TaxID=110450 RepID=A0A6G1DT28_9ORYZ|nr:hypothetical protein E2562_031926 [Oryza meyeriana var. granulata]
MAMGLNRFTQWLWPGSAARVAATTHELPTAGLTSASFPDFPSGFREPDTVTFATAGAGERHRRRVRQKRAGNRRRSSREESRVDREFDMVIVPSDGGGCLSGSESDDSDWAIGWQEKLSPELQTDGDPDSCFAVLVRCYRHGQAEQAGRPEGHFLGAAGSLANGGGLSDGRNFV